MYQFIPFTAEYAGPRHRSIADLAHGFLSPDAKEQVLLLLNTINADSLTDIASWADEIKPTSRHIPTDPDTQDFIRKYPTSNEWHFVDLPVDATRYDVMEYAAFTRKDDIVQSAIKSINILLGNSEDFSKLNALRWLVHLVGDMHQPLHLACSYIDGSSGQPKLVFEKDEILEKHLLQKSDRGGNKILLPNGKALHSYWDGDLPERDNNFLGYDYSPPTTVSREKLIDLPAQWVGEIVQFAAQAYKGLTITGFNNAQVTKVDVTWNEAEYDQRCIPIVKEICEKAASRLAFLLNTIYG